VVDSAALHSNAALASSSTDAEREAIAPTASISSYRWNLTNDGLPLISLPDHISEGLDLSLTYSMDQFEFPLFQSLYFNERAGKYILMVIPKVGRDGQVVSPRGVLSRRTEFIDLYPVKGRNEFDANGKLSLRVIDNGKIKLLSTSDGTFYTFATLADGELHCSRIKDRDGVIIDLDYTKDSSIHTIADSWGRSIKFRYTNNYVSAITQTWGANSAKFKKTWVIADEVSYAHRPMVYAGPTGAAAKHIPSNAIKPAYTAAMATSDLKLAAIFGGPGAVAAANGFEPARLGSQYPLYRGDLVGDDGRILRGHLSLAMHLYGSEDGRSETAVYVPLGFTSHTNEPTPTDAVVTFYYPRLGNLTDVTLAVFHVTNFQLINEQRRVRIGTIGGPGGSVPSYKHSHLEFYRGDTGLPPLAARTELRIDPATVFTSAN